MRVSQILLSTCAVLCIAWPATSLADPPTDQNQRGHEDHQKGAPAARPAPQGAQGGQRGPQGERGGQAVQPGPQSYAPSQGGAGRNRGQSFGQQSPSGAQGYQTRDRGQGGAQATEPSAQGAPMRNRGQPGNQAGARFQPGVQSGAGRGQYGVQGGAQSGQRNRAGQAAVGTRANARGPSGPALGGWNPAVRGTQRVQAGQVWRQQNQGFDQRAVWRSNRNWWRQDSGFSLFSGLRVGFFFIPEIGYVSAPRGYWGRHWRDGEFLPRWYWRYEVRDFWRYGLPRPPEGCAWVWVDRDVALVALDDGYILDIIHNVW